MTERSQIDGSDDGISSETESRRTANRSARRRYQPLSADEASVNFRTRENALATAALGYKESSWECSAPESRGLKKSGQDVMFIGERFVDTEMLNKFKPSRAIHSKLRGR